jgi:hypothetical protein
MRNLIIILFIAYIFATQHMIGGYLEINDKLSESLAKLMLVCSNSDSTDLNDEYKDLTE